jgi:hypothetical protein
MRYLAWLLFPIAILIMWFTAPVSAHDPDHHDHDKWYASIKIPNSGASCCGVSDAYFCNNLEVVGEDTFCTVTDDRDDGPRKRPHVPVGTKVKIPAEKLIRDEEAKKGNPTGQGVIWMRAGVVDVDTGAVTPYHPKDYLVFCYFMPDMT